ncbi:MAG: hypothetical protein WBA22_06405 [Candidatus Methanofastidiosia archaeon]
MNISRDQAANLVEEKISLFQKILKEDTYENRYSDEYQLAREETLRLLTDLFSEAEAEEFKNRVNPQVPFVVTTNHEMMLRKYRGLIGRYIVELKEYKERIQNFWSDGRTGRDEEKLTEKALLLMRFYWRDKVYEIGKQMNLPYFDEFDDYWEMGHYKGALKIAETITDEDLLKIIRDNPPKYKLSLGGFQGNYYTAKENGEVELTSSWEKVRENVQWCLEKRKGKAFGVLKAMINKKGHAAYFDLIDEIENVLGYEYFPSNILPRLSPRKLIFKTGSNKYPDWTMPPEIIPVVQEELSFFETSAGEMEKAIAKKGMSGRNGMSAQILQADHIISDLAYRITEKRREINLIFRRKFKTKIFKESEMAILDIRKPCGNEESFNNRILALSTMIDRMNTRKLGEQAGLDMRDGSINNLERFLDSSFPNYDKRVIANLRNIMILRSGKYPIHSDNPRFIRAIEHFGMSYPPDWGELWEITLRKFLESLELLYERLAEDQR